MRIDTKGWIAVFVVGIVCFVFSPMIITKYYYPDLYKAKVENKRLLVEKARLEDELYQKTIELLEEQEKRLALQERIGPYLEFLDSFSKLNNELREKSSKIVEQLSRRLKELEKSGEDEAEKWGKIAEDLTRAFNDMMKELERGKKEQRFLPLIPQGSKKDTSV